MPNPLFEKLAKLPEYEDYARYINKVREDAKDSEFFGLVAHELERVERSLLQALIKSTGNDALKIAGALGGVHAVREAIFTQWPIMDDKEEVNA